MFAGASGTAADTSDASGSPSEGETESDASASDRSAERPERGAPATDESSRSLSAVDPPVSYTYGLGVSPSVLFWDTAYGGQETAFAVMADAHARVSPPFVASLHVGYTRRAPSAGNLVVANDHVTAMGGFGVQGWLQTLRLGLQAQGGVVSRRLTITDGTGTTYRDSRFTPAAGGRFSVGALFFDQFLVSLASGARFFAPKREEFYTGVEMGWLFVHSP